MKISACLIVKNEEEVIERALSRIILFADEIVVVDTGSNDKTVEIARRFTDKIYHFKWVDDFSKARNFAFSKASCDYLMWLDADDYITDENVQKILKLKNSNSTNDTYMFKYSCYEKGSKEPYFTFYRERLLKNCNACRFNGFIHEAICPFGKIFYTDIEIEHRRIKNSNSKRNLNIYRRHDFKSLSKRDKYYCAKEYFYNGYYKTAIVRLKQFLNEGDFLPNVYDAYITLYLCYKNLASERVDILFDCMKKCPVTSELLCLIGDYFLGVCEMEKAIDFYKFAIDCEKPKDSLYFIKNEYYYLLPLLRLVYAFYKVGDIENALKYHKVCLKKYPLDKRTAYNQEFFKAKIK